MSGTHRGHGWKARYLVGLAILLSSPWLAQGLFSAPNEWLRVARGAGPNDVFMPLFFKPSGTTPTPTPHAVFFDSFSNPSSGWPRSEDANRRVDYVDGEYQILIKVSPLQILATPGVQCTDCAVDLDGRFASSSLGAWGILFGITDALDTYAFLINGGQEYSLYRRAGAAWQTLIDWTPSTSIRSGQATNHLRVERLGSAIVLRANGLHLHTFYDDSLVGSLRVGATAIAFETPNVDVRLDNYAVYAFSGSLDVAPGGAALSALAVTPDLEP